jgi:TetR/AcrR family transcriptional regulator, ethionamide resistance regulator
MPASADQRKRAPRVPAVEARRRIIDAANRLLRERRFRELTVEDVMAEAGLPRTVFYRHFDGIASIVLGLLDDLLAGVLYETEVGDQSDRSMMRRQLALAVDTFGRYGPLLLALDEASHHDDEVEHAYRAWIDHSVDAIAGAIELGVADGHTPPLPVHDVAQALTAMNRQYLLDLIARDPDFDRDAALEALWTVWMRTTWPDPLPGDGADRSRSA